MIRYITIAILSIVFFASQSFAQEKAKDDILYVVDGKVQPDSFDANSLDVYEIKTINILKGEEALKKHGVEYVMEVNTKSKKVSGKDDNTSVRIIGDNSKKENDFFEKNGIYVSPGVDLEHYVTGNETYFDYSTKTFRSVDQKLSYDYSRSFREDTFEKDYSIEIDENLESVSLRVSGSLRNGSAVISLKDSKDKLLISSLEIDQYGSVSLRKKINFEDGNVNSGTWKLSINAKEATGNFKLYITGY